MEGGWKLVLHRAQREAEGFFAEREVGKCAMNDGCWWWLGDEVDLNCLLFSIHFPMYKIIMYKSTHSLHLVPGDEQVE